MSRPGGKASHGARKAVAELERMGADPELREIYEAEEKARMVDIAELQYAVQQGISQGITQGITQGVQRGQQHLLLRQMTRQFGDVPENVAARLHTLTQDELENLGEALFNLHSYAEIEAWLSRQ